MNTQINSSDWGSARVADVQKVLESVVDVMDSYFESSIDSDIIVKYHETEGPMVLYDNGEYQVLLSSNNTYWAQYSYQFSHEYCHIRTNYIYDNPKTKWFEETICELASLFTLRRMSEVWKTSPPYENWSDYSSALYDYSKNWTEEEGKTLPKNIEFLDWFRANLSSLENDRYIRKDNAIIAIKLLPIFEANTKLWLAITYLNTWTIMAPYDIYQLFDNWLSCVPNELKSVVNILVHEFGATNQNN